MTMIYTNITTIKYFIIIGFPGLPPEYYGPVSALLLLVFLAIVIGNGFTIAVIICERTLHKSLYVIFCHLAMTDMCFGMVILPKIIARYWWNDMISSFGACFTQMFFINLVEATHCFIFLVMALDRFVAISFPFKYPVIFTNKAVSIACTMSWVLTFVRIWEPLFRNLNLPYCDQNIIMQCYCDLLSITRLACGDEVVSRAGFVLANAMVTFMVPLTVSILSYFSVMVTVLTMPETERRHKVLSTCAPQIFITCLYYVPRCFVFIANTVGFNFSLLARVVIGMTYSLIPPVVNPVIYCFKTKDIKNALMRRFKNIKARIAIRTQIK